MENKFYCGTSNIELPVPNKTHFPIEYRERSRLSYYASIFNSLEINSSFYKIPMNRTVERWYTEVPEYFRFSFKLWRGITHEKELLYRLEDITRFLQAIEPVGQKKGCLLIQFPASVKFPSIQKIEHLLEDIANNKEVNGWNLAIEFRDRSWYNDTVFQLLEKYRASMVFHDMPASGSTLIDMKSDIVYMRFHGEKGDYRGNYSNEFLITISNLVKACLAGNKTVFAYFNNTMGNAVQNALSLTRGNL